MYNIIIPCNLSHIIVPKYCYVGASLVMSHNLQSSNYVSMSLEIFFFLGG